MEGQTMKYGRAIRIVRAARGLSQKELALRANVDPSYISLLESEARAPSTALLTQLSRALDAPPYLISLLASGKSQLKGISSNEAQFLSSKLLEILTNVEREAKGRKRTPG